MFDAGQTDEAYRAQTVERRENARAAFQVSSHPGVRRVLLAQMMAYDSVVSLIDGVAP